jgi:hypothetical protein
MAISMRKSPAVPLVFLSLALLTGFGPVSVENREPGALGLHRRALETAQPQSRERRRRGVFVNGDSLAVGTRPYLPRYLRGWRVRQSVSISRHAPEGVSLLRRMRHLPRVVVMSLGTNDDPRAVDTFRSAVRSATHLAGKAGGEHCVVWPNIVRPAVAGASYSGYNHVLAKENRRHRALRVVKWTRIVRKRGIALAGDGVHPTASGYRVRAKAIAREVRRCRER